jgi:2-keto-4-pentenoate hydratase/2-oxohepta-3-ene-1,7-dioic acid hydratase in catechol pathway
MDESIGTRGPVTQGEHVLAGLLSSDMPNLSPSKIVCVGRNYAAHAKELGNEVPKSPLIFLKPPSSIVRDGESIRLPTVSKQVEYEGEIGVIVGKRLFKASADEARGAVAGIVAGNDVTARDLQKSDGQWTRAKGFDTFCALGKIGEVPTDLSALTVTTRVNGNVRQEGRASDMVFDIPALLSFISGIMTLEPGDLVLTGTPDGVGTLAPGDVVEVEIAGVSRVSNPVTSDA